MYTATMEYEFETDRFDEACKLWKEDVLGLAESQPGFIRMQFLTSKPKALAIGTWESSDNAQKFMQTGVFKDLMVKLADLVIGDPIPRIWELKYFADK